MPSVEALASWTAGLHGAPDLLQLCQRLQTGVAAHFGATTATVFTAVPGTHFTKLRRYDDARLDFDIVDRLPGVVSSAWTGTPPIVSGTGGMNPAVVEPRHNTNDHYLAVSIPSITLRHTVAVVLMTRAHVEPAFGPPETTSLAELLREHVAVAVHTASRNEAVLRTLDLLLNGARRSHQPDLTSVLRLILRDSARLVNCSRVGLFVLDAAQRMLVARVFDETQDDSDQRRLTDVRIRTDQGIAGLVATTGKPMMVDNATEHPNFHSGVDERTGIQTKSLLCVPLRRNSTILGVVSWVNKLDSDGAITTFTGQDLEDCVLLSSYYALAIANAQLQEAQRKSDDQTKVAIDLMAYHVVATDEEVATVMAAPKVALGAIDGFFSPLWDAAVATDAETVPILAAMFEHLGYVAKYSINYTTLIRFLLTVRRGYRKVPYHNWRHAFSVAHFCFVILATQPVDRYLENYEQFGLLLAATCHDIDHRGRNNAFMTRANNPIAQLYNVGSVMEQHHFSFTVTLLSDPAVNILANVTPEVYTAVLQQVRHVIMATDLATHFQSRSAIRRLVEDLPSFDRTNVEHRHHVTALIMTSSDISSILKPWEVTVDVTRAIYTEFFTQVRGGSDGAYAHNDLVQGDEELAMGHKPGLMMDRKNASIPQQQLGFMDAVAIDVYDCLQLIFPSLTPAYEQLRLNRTLWAAEAKKVQEQGEHDVSHSEVRYLPTH